MVKVECDGCKAPYQIDEKRIPPTGLKMRCPKCGTNLLVTRPGAQPPGEADLPAVAGRGAPPGAPPGPARSAGAPPPRPPPPRAPPPAAKVPAFGEIDEPEADLPMTRSGFGEIDLMVDLPPPGAPAQEWSAPPADVDLPATRGATQRGPGDVDLPAFHGGRGGRPDFAPPPAAAPAAWPPQEQTDLPAMPGHTDLPMASGHAGPPGPPGPAPRKRNPTVNFGDIDLPVAPPPGAPPAARGRSVNFGDIELPGVPENVPPGAGGGGFGEIDLPQPAHHGGLPSTGHTDLPAAQHSAGLPMPAHGPGLPAPAYGAGGPAPGYGADLPAPAYGPGLPAPAHGPGLPSPAYGPGLPMTAQGPGLPSPAYGAGLPSPAYGPGLPATAQGPGLPSPAYGPGLPAPAYGPGLPAPAYGPGLPAPAYGPALPAAAQGQGLPMPAYGSGLPMSAQGAGFPMHAPGGGLPMSAQGAGFPQHAPGGGLPMSAQGAGFPQHAPGGGLPMSAQGAGFPMPSDGFPMHSADGLPMTAQSDLPSPAFGDLDYGGRSNAFDDSDRAVPQTGEGGDLGSVGIDLDGGPAPVVMGGEAGSAFNPDVAGEGALPGQRRERLAEPAPRKSNARRVGLLVAVAATLTGGAFALVPTVGPFGVYFVADKINAKSNAAAFDELRKTVDASLDDDTHTAVSAAVERCNAGRAAMKRYAPATAYCAYIALERGLRFGRRTDDEALAKQLLADARDAGGDYGTLATAALDLLAGQPAKARGPVAALAQRLPQDVDVAVVAADVELADKATAPAAVTAWTRAVTVHKSARTLFGLARAQLASGDAKTAEATARAVLLMSKAHAGARMLVAAAIWTDATREAEALSLLKEVTDTGPVSKAAGEGEMVDAYTQLGSIHLARSRMSAAEQAFAAALKLNPLAVRALIGNGELFYRSGRYSEALARFEAATNADPESIVAKVGIAKTNIALEQMKGAKDMLKKLREARPGEPLVSLWLGHAEEALGNKKEAEASYVEAVKAGGSRPEAVDAYVALAHLLSGIGRSDDANAQLAEATKKFPDLPALHRARGEVALQMGRYDEAHRELQASLDKEEDLGARFHLGVALRRMRRFDDAGAIFDKVAGIDKDYPGLALERGLLFQETGQSDRALESYRKALEKAPNDIDLKLRVGSTQVMAGHPADALKTLDEVRKARPNSAEANHFLGRALLARGENLAEAMRYLEMAVNIDSNRPEYYLYVGWAANELGQPAKAAPALNKALDLDHELGDAYWQRGVLLQKQGATQDALHDLQTALEKRPSRFEAWATIALCDQDLQKWPDAEAAWRHALAGNDDQPEWHYRLGKELGAHGNRAGVVPELEKAVDLASRPDQPPYPWLYDAHFLLAEALPHTPANKAKVIEHYQRFLDLAPAGNAYRVEAEKALLGLGFRQNR